MADAPPAPFRELLPGRAKLRGFTLPEVITALFIAGLLMAAVLSQWIESTSLALKAAETLEHTRSTRELVYRLSEDVRNSQSITIYKAFDDREEPCHDKESGNYLVLREISLEEEITRTVGYYLLEDADGGWILYRHDSETGKLDPEELPEPITAGAHVAVTRAVTLPESNRLFRCLRDRGVAIRGEFGAAGPVKRGRTEFVQCALSTRS